MKLFYILSNFLEIMICLGLAGMALFGVVSHLWRFAIRPTMFRVLPGED